MKTWLLFGIGSLIYFMIRYIGRTDKAKDFSLAFWFKDNIPELSVVFGLDLILMIILSDSRVNVSGFLAKHLPEGIVVPAELIIGAACGLGLGYAGYEFIQKTIKKKVAKVDEPVIPKE